MIIPEIPTFAEFFQLTSKTGRKELFAARWRTFPDTRKIEIFKKVKELKEKPNPEKVF